MINGLFYKYLRTHFYSESAYCLIFVCNYPEWPRVAAAIWPCAYLFCYGLLLYISSYYVYEYYYSIIYRRFV